LPPLKFLMLRRVKRILPLPCSRGVHFRANRQSGQNASWHQEPAQPIGEQEPRIGSELLTFLAEGYKFKTIAD